MTGQHRVMTPCRASSFEQCPTVREICKFFSDNTILVKVDQESFFYATFAVDERMDKPFVEERSIFLIAEPKLIVLSLEKLY